MAINRIFWCFFISFIIAYPLFGQQKGERLKKKREAILTNVDTLFFQIKKIKYMYFRDAKGKVKYQNLANDPEELLYYNPLSNPDKPKSNIGTVASPLQNIIFFNDNQLGNYIGNEPFYNAYYVPEEKEKFYSTPVTLSRFKYIDYRLRERNVNVIFSRNVHERMNTTLTYNRNNGTSDYNNQQFDFLKASFNAYYFSKKGKYKTWFSTSHQILRNQESGGIRDTSIFTDTANNITLGSLRQISTNFNDAERRVTINRVIFKQSLAWGKLKIDSLRSNILQKAPSFEIMHTSVYQQDLQNFKINLDQTTITQGVLPTLSIAKMGVIDNKIDRFEHKHQIETIMHVENSSDTHFNLNIGTQIAFYDISQQQHRFVENQVQLWAQSRFQIRKRYSLSLALKRVIAGYQQSDFNYKAQLKIAPGKHEMMVKAAWFKNAPSYLSQVASNTFYQWEHEFQSVQGNHLSFNYAYGKNIALSAEVYRFKNYIYWSSQNNFLFPKQLPSNLSVYKLGLSFLIPIKFLKLKSSIFYQKSSFQEAISLPSLYYFAALYIDVFSPFNEIFKIKSNNNRVLLGLEMRYYQNYAIPAYDPVFGIYHWKNNPIRKTIPVYDLFLLIQFKKADLMFKYEHVFQQRDLLFRFSTQQYPSPLRGLKVGVIWNIYK